MDITKLKNEFERFFQLALEADDLNAIFAVDFSLFPPAAKLTDAEMQEIIDYANGKFTELHFIFDVASGTSLYDHYKALTMLFAKTEADFKQIEGDSPFFYIPDED